MFEDLVGLRNRSNDRYNYHIYDVDGLNHPRVESDEDTHRRAWIIDLFHELLFMKDHKPGMISVKGSLLIGNAKIVPRIRHGPPSFPTGTTKALSNGLVSLSSQRDKDCKRMGGVRICAQCVH